MRAASRQITAPVTFAAVYPATQLGGVAEAVRARLFPDARIERMLEAEMKPLLAELEKKPALEKMSQQEAESFTAQLTARGLKRLPGAQLATWNDLRMRLADASPRLCAGLWLGGNDRDVVMHAFRELDDDDLTAYARVCAEAALLELRQAAFVPPPQDAFGDALLAIAAALGTEERARFERVLGQGLSAAPEDGCWLVRTLMERAASQRGRDREVLLRALAMASEP